MRVLVTGAKGLMGREVVAAFSARQHEVTAVRHADFDLTNLENIAKLGVGMMGDFEWCVNCAAIPDVDKAEADERLATEVNGLGVGYLVQACHQIGTKLIHFSTDYVFNGEATEPYAEDAAPSPVNAYGRSKLVGERALEGRPNAIIVRTGVLFGPEGKCNATSLIEAMRARKPIKAAADTTANPTYTVDLARVIVDLAEKNAFPGIYHAVGPESMSRLEFARRLLSNVAGHPVEVLPFTPEEEAARVRRPRYTCLADTRLKPLGIEPMRPLDEAIEAFCMHIPGIPMR